MANGNFSAERRYLPQNSSEYSSGLKAADDRYSGAGKGVELSEELRGKKLGKFLMGVSLEILRRQGIKTLDMSGDISLELLPIATKLGYSEKNKKIDISSIPSPLTYSFIAPFVN